MRTGLAPRRTIGADIRDSGEPILQVLAYIRLTAEHLAVQAVLFYILDRSLDLTFALRVIPLSGMNAAPDGGGILVEALIQRQLPVLLADHDHY
jgi:hypothetical protein